MSHEPFDNLAAGYAVGALDGEDLVRFEAHLAEGCRECETEVRESQEALAALTREGPRAIPPAHVKESLLRRITDTSAPAPRASRGTWPWRWVLGSAVAAAFIAAFSAGFVAVRYEAAIGRMARETAAIREGLRRDRAALEKQFASSGNVGELLRDPATRVVTLQGQGATPDALARVVWNDRAGGHIFIANLPPVSRGKVYELWTIGAGAPRPAGLLDVQAGGTANLKIAPHPEGEPVKVFAVTLEPAGGTRAPTGPMILASK